VPLWVILSIWMCSSGVGQELNKLQLQEKIQLTEQLLSETQEKQERSMTELNLIDSQIKLRRQLLRSLNGQIVLQNQEIDKLTLSIDRLEREVEEIKAIYAETLRHAYKTFNVQSFWLSLLSANSLSEAYYRGLYFVEFSRYQRKQIRTITDKQEELEDERNALIEGNREKAKLVAEKRDEIERLAQTQLQHQDILKLLKRKEQSYVAQIGADRERLRELIRKIDKRYGKVPEFYKVADVGESFEEQKGFHYWPIPSSKGIIVGKFGKTEDPFGNPIQNDGIHLRTSQGQFVRSIFQGTVTGVQKLPMNGHIVIVEHGPYRSVYANLESVKVKAGDYVGERQSLGVVRTDPRNGSTLLNFLIYKVPDTFLDPEGWIFVD